VTVPDKRQEWTDGLRRNKNHPEERVRSLVKRLPNGKGMKYWRPGSGKGFYTKAKSEFVRPPKKMEAQFRHETG